MEIKTVIYVGIALVILFLMATTMVLPYFANNYEYGYGNQPCNKDSTCSLSSTNLGNGYCKTGSTTNATCASCNSSTGYETFLSSCSSLFKNPDGKIINSTHCFACTDFGFKGTSQGLLLFIFFMGMIGFAVTFLKYVKK